MYPFGPKPVPAPDRPKPPASPKPASGLNPPQSGALRHATGQLASNHAYPDRSWVAARLAHGSSRADTSRGQRSLAPFAGVVDAIQDELDREATEPGRTPAMLRTAHRRAAIAVENLLAALPESEQPTLDAPHTASGAGRELQHLRRRAGANPDRVAAMLSELLGPGSDA